MIAEKTFELRSLTFRKAPIQTFTEATAPDWLTSKNTVKGSTMDDRWFWEGYVLTLRIGQSVKTDFSKITRIA